MWHSSTISFTVSLFTFFSNKSFLAAPAIIFFISADIDASSSHSDFFSDLNIFEVLKHTLVLHPVRDQSNALPDPHHCAVKISNRCHHISVKIFPKLYLKTLSSLNKSIQKTQQFNGLSTLRKTPLPLKIGAVFLYIFWTP